MKWKSKSHEDSDSDDSDNENDSVRVDGTDIYFYGDVDNDNILELITQMRSMERKLLKRAIDLPGYTPTITLHIKSDGGDVYAGMSAMDHLEGMRINVRTIAEGCCASAATFLLLGGKERFVTKRCQVLIHQISSEFWGKYEELKDEIKTCDKLMNIIKKIYDEKTKIPSKKLKTMMKRDIYLTAEECVEYGIAACL